MMSILAPRVVLRSGNEMRNLDFDRTKTFRIRSAGGFNSRERRIADPVEPVAPSSAYVGICRARKTTVSSFVF